MFAESGMVGLSDGRPAITFGRNELSSGIKAR
jgi:hypothetical protein